MTGVFIRGSKREVNDLLKAGKDIPTLAYTKKAERQAMLSEYDTGIDINLWDEHDSNRIPIVKAYGIYNKVKNKIE